MCMSALRACISVNPYVQRPVEARRGHCLGLELWTGVSYHVGAGNRTVSLGKHSQLSLRGGILKR